MLKGVVFTLILHCYQILICIGDLKRNAVQTRQVGSVSETGIA